MQFHPSIFALFITPFMPLDLFASQTESNNLNESEVATFEYPSWVSDIADDTEFKTTLIYRNFLDNQYFKDSVLGLAEAQYQGEDYTVDVGIMYRNVPESEVSLNQFSYAYEADNFDFKAGKFVSKIGVMDFLSFVDVFNNTRAEYFDDANVNIHYKPSWMVKLDAYPDDNTTFGLYLKPYDQDSNTLFGDSIQFGLNSVVPFIVTNTGNSDLDLIGREVLLPAYEDGGAKDAGSDYIFDKLPNEDPRFDNTSIFLNFVITEDNYTFGAVHTSAYSSLPIFIFDTDFVSAVGALGTEEDKEQYIADYLEDENNEPIKALEYFRYNQFALYYESSIGQFGYRAELSYRDKFPLIYRTSSMVTLGLGVDHQSTFYNNLEFQYSKFDSSELDAYYFIWLFKTDSKRFGNWDVSLQNMFTYGVYDSYDVWANFSGVQLELDNYQISLEYLTHSEQQYLNDTAAIKFKVEL
ncbi:MAG: hypothetical protein JXK16_00335 [Thiotrichales bacterium]|nr:hypothetical protein [Thiotrichales bacterium]